MVLLRVEFTLQRAIASRPVRSYRTLSPLPVPKAIGGLLSAALVVACAPQALPGTLLFEARTFLPFVSLPKDVNVSLPKDFNVSLPKDINKAATTQSAPVADCIELSLKCLGKTPTQAKSLIIEVF